MTYLVRVEGSAQTELEVAVHWYERQQAGLGPQLLHEVQRTVEILSRHPFIGSKVPFVSSSLGVRRVLVRRFPFALVYRLLPQEIQIIAFAHTRREPGYWGNR